MTVYRFYITFRGKTVYRSTKGEVAQTPAITAAYAKLDTIAAMLGLCGLDREATDLDFGLSVSR